jgi:hypothetical protein
MEGAVRARPQAGAGGARDEARRWFGDIPWLADELVVVGDGGQVWAGPAAFLTCLWALRDWREWFLPAGRARAGASQRRSVAALFDHRCTDGSCGLNR